MRKAAEIVLLSEERAQLLQLARSKTVSVRDWRAARRSSWVRPTAWIIERSPPKWALAVCKSDAGAIAISRADWRRLSRTCRAAGDR